MTQRDGMGWDVGRGFRMGSVCIPVAEITKGLQLPFPTPRCIVLRMMLRLHPEKEYGFLSASPGKGAPSYISFLAPL